MNTVSTATCPSATKWRLAWAVFGALAAIPQPAAVDLDTLAATYAEAGRYEDATATATTAIGLARRAGNDTLAAQVETRRALYMAGRPFHADPKPAPP